MAKKFFLQRGLALALAPCLMAMAAGQAWAASKVPPVPAALRADTSALQTVMHNDFWVQGTILGAANGSLNVNLLGIPWQGSLVSQTQVQVGPYTADTTFLLTGNTAKVYFHLDGSGTPVVDLVQVTPTVVKGSLTNVTDVNGTDASEGQVLNVLTASTTNPTVNVDVTASTKVRILPPWSASQGLNAVNQVEAVGVTAPNGDVLAAVVVGVVSQN